MMVSLKAMLQGMVFAGGSGVGVFTGV